MVSGRARLVLAYALALVVLAAGAFVYVQQRREARDPFRDADTVAAAAAMPFTVTLSVPSTGRTTLGTTLTVAAAGVSSGTIEDFQLFDADVLVASGPAGTSGSAILSYPALWVGTRQLYVRATDDSGAVAFSAPVRLQVDQPRAAGTIGVPVSVLPQETGADVAKRLRVSQKSVYVSPAADAPPEAQPAPATPDEPFPKGAAAVVVVTADPAQGSIDKAVVHGSSPALTVAAQGCAVTLTGPASGGAVVFVEATASGWVEVGSVTSPRSLRLAAVAPATHVYAVRPAQGRANQQSSGVSVDVPVSCSGAGGAWTGSARIVDGQLYLDDPPGNQVFVYLLVDDQPARRIPSSQDLILPGTAINDISDQLPRLVGSSLDIEVWSAGEVSLEKAEGHLTVPPGQSIQSIVGEPNLLSLAFADDPNRYSIDLDNDDAVTKFAWTSESSRVGKVLWQVTTSEPRSRNLSLVPDGLIASGVSASTASGTDRSTGTFTVDSAQIPGHAEVSQNPGASTGLEKATGPGPAVALMKPGSASYAKTPPTAPAGTSILLQGYVPPPAGGDPVYVRVLALPEDSGVTAASAAKKIILPSVEDASTGDPVDLTLDKVIVDLGRAPNLGLASCARVTVPWDDLPPPGWKAYQYGVARDFSDYAPFGANVAFVQPYYQKSGTYCPGDWPPVECGFFCDVIDGLVSIGEVVVSFVTELYGVISYAYNGIIETVVSVIANGPLCQLLASAGKTAGKVCVTVVGAVASAAISAVLAFYGLPPRLPSVDSLKAIAAGELDALAVELMKYVGVPCDELAQDPDTVAAAVVAAKESGVDPVYVEAAGNPCLAVARLAISLVKKQVTEATSTAVAQATGLPSLLDVKGASMVPEPKGQLQPWYITITASPKRANADLTGLACRVGVKQVGQPHVTQNSEYRGFLKPDGKGKLSGVITMYPGRPELLSGLAVTLAVKPYVTQCAFPTTTITQTVEPSLNR